MKCIDNLQEVKLNNTVVTIGKFDGLHKGHSKLFDVLRQNAAGRTSVVLTFAGKPMDVISRSKSRSIVTEEEKKLLCDSKGIDYYISLPLTKEFLDLAPEAFIRDVLIETLGMSMIVCGPDFKFGKFGAGDVSLLKKLEKYYDYEVVVVQKEQYHNVDIGSTEIRQKIADGDIISANAMLGYPYSVIARVQEGKRLGREIGFPTANAIPDEGKILPPNGVYRTKTKVNGKVYNSISNVGINPTVEDGQNIKIETHIIDFDEDIYGEIVTVQFFEFIRPEQKFESVEELKKQIQKDMEKVR